MDHMEAHAFSLHEDSLGNAAIKVRLLDFDAPELRTSMQLIKRRFDGILVFYSRYPLVPNTSFFLLALSRLTLCSFSATLAMPTSWVSGAH